MRVIDSWTNSRGERVEMRDDGRLVVLAANGQPVPGAALNAARCDRSAPPATPARSAVAQQVAAYEEEAKAHPGLRVLVNAQSGEVMAACLEPVPYWKQPKK